MIRGTRASNSFPSESDGLDYFETLPEYQEKIKEFKIRIVKLMSDLASNVDANDDIFNLSYLNDADPSEFASFEPVANVIELLLENVDSYLDEAVKKYKGNSALINKEGNRQVEMSKGELVRDIRAGLNGVVTHANIKRPQLGFKTPVDNSRNAFKPKLVKKPNAIEEIPPGGYSLINMLNDPQQLEDEHESIDVINENYFSQIRYPNPYEIEIKNALASPPEWILEQVERKQGFKPLEEVSCTWVDSEEKLKDMLSILKDQDAIAIDLENHSYRSFQGFLCLMQVSTREQDWLVDTIALRDSLECLNEVFTDPNIIKVLHGADFDVTWLQRDFGLYLVSLFDTGQATRVLGYPSFGLAYALNLHAKVRVNKVFQLADWRIRPLSDDLLKYAREDTHYLLHVFDCVRKELLNQGGKDAIKEVLRKSTDIALKVHEKPIFTTNSWKRLLKTNNLQLTEKQSQILSAVYEWRDKVARREDESTQYVLPDRMLIRIAQDQPCNASELERSCNPLPPVVQTRVTELLALVRSSKDSSSIDIDNNNNNSNNRKEKEQEAEANPLKPIPQNSEKKNSNLLGQIGLNSCKSTFVPIVSNQNKVSFVDDNNKNDNSDLIDKREMALRKKASERATPSPVLTTEQLYDTAGWQDLADYKWKASVLSSENNIKSSHSNKMNVKKKSINDNKSFNYRTALETRAKIGEEQLDGTFGALPNRNSTPLVANNNIKNIHKQVEDEDSQMIDIDTPADADALESEDIPRSLAEIYRISNRNRKRNKDKKKGTYNNSSSVMTCNNKSNKNENEESGDEVSIRKRIKDGDYTGVTSSNNTAGNSTEQGDDAIEFMRTIGWVEGKEKPVASLTIEGAPQENNQDFHTHSTTTPNEDGHNNKWYNNKLYSQSKYSSPQNTTNHGGKSRASGRKIPSSPQKTKNKGGGIPSSNKQQQQQQVSSGFSYSQATSNIAGIRASNNPNSYNNNSSVERNNFNKNSSRERQQQSQSGIYRKANSNIHSMSYSNSNK